MTSIKCMSLARLMKKKKGEQIANIRNQRGDIIIDSTGIKREI